MIKIAKTLLLLLLAAGIGILIYQGTRESANAPDIISTSSPAPAAAGAPHPAPRKEHLVATFSKLLEQEGPMDLNAWNDLLEQFIRHDPHTLAALVEKLPPQSSTREFLMYRVAQKWAALDADGAAAWAKGIYFLTDRDKMVASVCQEIAQKDPWMALQTAESCNPPLQLPGVYQSLVSQLAKRDFNTALEWARNQIDQEAQGQLLQGLALVQAENDPESAAFFVAEQMASGTAQVQEEAALSVILQWARTDPVAARNWAATFPNENLKELAAQEISAAQDASKE